jgi:hypothetical protein
MSCGPLDARSSRTSIVTGRRAFDLLAAPRELVERLAFALQRRYIGGTCKAIAL